MKTLDVLISTFGSRVQDISNLLLEPIEGVRYLVGHQCASNIDISKLNFLERRDVFYYALESTGVTKSRNYLLNKATSDIVYFCDDDIVLDVDCFKTIVESHSKNKSQVITFIVNDLDGNPRGRYPNSESNRSYANILSVGTIEISLKRECYESVRFSEDMGAGTDIPIGDEAVFLADCIRNDMKILFVPTVICSHPLESSGSSVSETSVFARGVAFRRVFGWCGWFILLPFFLKRAKLFTIDDGMIKSFFIFVSGFNFK
ncbi:glycosyltransferase family 2 protein [Shewanella frigidimarina]|uniref:glycosyltransferase family A protein n=1 Tax=Shewanella frigidimarina TaxID=56812 RepID=UPI000F4EC2BC|nr:glycosyltransferase family A protein [Shewanella frigidimarina]RPA63837.1 glycosyltransferase family 2 protein [Shewanella frigidimarina]